MTPWQAAGWRFQDEDKARVATSDLDDGGQMQVRFLGETLARVSLRPAGGWREPRTWAIAPQGKAPWEGREREDPSGFDLPATQAGENRFCTSHLSVTLGTGPLGPAPGPRRLGAPLPGP